MARDEGMEHIATVTLGLIVAAVAIFAVGIGVGIALCKWL